MLYNTKIILTKNRARIIKSNRLLEVGYETKTQRQNYQKATQGDKSEYSYKRALDNLVLTIDSNVNYYSKFITLTFTDAELEYNKAMKKFNSFRKFFKREFGQNLKYTRIAERQKERGEKENNLGSWHFHLIVYNSKKIDFKRLKKCWPYGSVDIKKVDNNKNLARYFGKYFSKQKSDISINDKLVSHSIGLQKPNIIYSEDITAFDNYDLLYHKKYSFKDQNIEFELNEYDISKIK